MTTRKILAFLLSLALLPFCAVSCLNAELAPEPPLWAPVTGVSLNQSSLSLTAGSSQTLTATVTPDNATNKSVTWSSSNSGVASVSSSGVVTAVSSGTATITVKTTDGSKTATCSVSVTPATVHVTGVGLTPSLVMITEGSSSTLAATVSPSNATDKSVTWSSSDSGVASVSSSGVVTAVSAGTATITVRTTDGSKTATCAVSVTPAMVHVSGVSLSKSSLSLTVGSSQTLTATVSPSNATDKSVTWSSSNSGVASVSSSGVVTAVSAGTATITVKTTDGGKTATCTVMVSSSTPTPSGAVDMGLSVKWAACNLGASSPEESGGYYQWAGTRDVASTSIYLDWSNCPYHNGSSYSSGWTKYNTLSNYGTVDNRTTLEPGDDAAHVKLGGSWRMPTDAEWLELKNNCTWTWTWTTLKGKNGYNVTSKKNGNSIFLPAAGGRSSDYLGGVGSNGGYWSSSLDTYNPHNACSVSFYSSSVGWSYRDRYCGLSVRPVSE